MNSRSSHQKVGQIMKYSNLGSGVSPCVGDVGDVGVGDVRPRKANLGRTLVTGLLAAVLVSTSSSSLAEEGAAEEVGKESGIGAAAAVSSLLYGPAKLLYATGGAIVGGLAYAFTAGDTEVAGKIFTRSLRGDYVITPAILTGNDTLEFIGRDLPDTTSPTASVAAAPPPPAYEDTEYDDLGW
jgi:hypothetical protein